MSIQGVSRKNEGNVKDFNNLVKELSDLLEQTHDAVFSWQLEKGITHWNRGAEKLYGYTQKEALGKHVPDFLETDYEISFEKLIAVVREKGKWEGELRQKTKDGRTVIAKTRLTTSYTESDGLTILETAHDITKAKAADERLQQQASLLEKTRDAILVCDLNHKIIYWNRGAEKLYGWKAEEVLGNEIARTICQCEYKSIQDTLKALEKKDDIQEERINYTKDGKEIDVISRWTLVRNELGQPDYFLIVNTDITDLKHTERQLLRAQRLESIGTLAGGMAHDLNNVLSPILMAVEMLQTDLDLPESSQPWLSVIRENTERGADLIKQVLTFAKGAGDGNHVEIQVAHIIKEQVKVLKQTFPQNINIEFRMDTPLASINADPTQIHQVLMNLSVNAKDAMESGGTLKITAENIKLDKNNAKMNPNAKPGSYVLISVEDSGIGMSPEILDRIWDPFYTTKEVGKGTGLGLSTALSIILGHEGFINAHSEMNRGTQFSVYLPALEIAREEISAKQPLPYPRGSGELILIVDDEKHICEITSAMLEKYGYRSITAADGTEALAIFTQQEKVDLVITDMAMPFMDGAATTRALRKINPDQKIIGSSGLMSPQETKNRELSVDGFLAKPFTNEKLLTLVADVLAD